MIDSDAVLEKVIKKRSMIENERERNQFEKSYYLDKLIKLNAKEEKLKEINKKKTIISYFISSILGLCIIYFIGFKIFPNINDIELLSGYLLSTPVFLIGFIGIIKSLSDKIIELKYNVKNNDKENVEKEVLQVKEKISVLEETLNKEIDILDLLTFIEDNVKYYSQNEDKKETILVNSYNKELTRKLEK